MDQHDVGRRGEPRRAPARSPELPLLATTETVGRRLADHLRETGVTAVIVDDVDPPAGLGSEKWRGVQDDRGVVSAYGIPVDERFAERLHRGVVTPMEKWTAVEFTVPQDIPTSQRNALSGRRRSSGPWRYPA